MEANQLLQSHPLKCVAWCYTLLLSWPWYFQYSNKGCLLCWSWCKRIWLTTFCTEKCKHFCVRYLVSLWRLLLIPTHFSTILQCFRDHFGWGSERLILSFWQERLFCLLAETKATPVIRVLNLYIHFCHFYPNIMKFNIFWFSLKCWSE